MIEDERMGDGSVQVGCLESSEIIVLHIDHYFNSVEGVLGLLVQEIVGDLVCPYFKADSYKFHAAGREDIDVRQGSYF